MNVQGSGAYIGSELDDWGLDPFEFRIYMRIVRRHSHEQGCTESVRNMAAACKMSAKTCRKALASLEAMRLIARTDRPGTSPRHDPLPRSAWVRRDKIVNTPSKSGTTISDPPTPTISDPPPPGTPTISDPGGGSKRVGVPLPYQIHEGTPFEGTPVKVDTENPMVGLSDDSRPQGDTGDPVGGDGQEDLKPDPPGDPEPEGDAPPPDPKYGLLDWNRQAASTMLDRLGALGVLSGVVKKQIRARGRETVVQEWADTFRLLQSQDGWTQAEVSHAMHWVLQASNKWIKKRWLQSAASLRQSTAAGDKTKFEAIYNQAISDANGKRKHTGESIDEAKRRIHAVASRALAS